MNFAYNIKKLMDFYQHLDAGKLDKLGEIYSDDVFFQDSAHSIHGLPALKTYFSGMMQHVGSCRFTILCAEVGATQAVIEWRMNFSHPRLNRGKNIEVAGVSLLSGDGKISRQRDYFDLGAMLYEHLPLMGAAVRHFKRRLLS